MRRFKARNLATMLVGVAIAVLFGATVLTPVAHAASSDCGGLYPMACFWYDANFSGTRIDYYYPNYGQCYNFSPGSNDKFSSLVNRSNWDLVLYKDINCSNFILGTLETYPNSNQSNLSGTGMNNEASSFKMTSGF